MADHFRDATKKIDCISREAAIAYIKDNQCKGCSDIGLCGNCAVLTALKLLENVPSADARPVVRGKWIRGNENRTSPIKDSYTCSVCGEKTLSGFCGNPAKTNFCPNCGADMREPNLDTTKGENHD
jgi:hypothetical protein